MAHGLTSAPTIVGPVSASSASAVSDHKFHDEDTAQPLDTREGHASQLYGSLLTTCRAALVHNSVAPPSHVIMGKSLA